MDIVELILSVGFINGLVIGVILFSLNNANRLATRIFGVIIILFSLVIGEELSEVNGLIFKFPWIFHIVDSFVLLISPLLFIYAQLITESKRKLKALDFFHALPFLLFTVYLLPFYLLPEDQKLAQLDYDPSGAISTIKVCVVATYFLVTLRFIILFEKSQRINGFPVNNSNNIRWFRGLLISLIVIGVLVIIMTITFNNGVAYPFDPDTFSVLALSIVFYGVSIKLMRNPFIFWNIRELEQASQAHFNQPQANINTRYKTSPLTRDDMENYMQQLRSTMMHEQPYLNPELAPKDLEEITGIKVYYISQVLSEVLNKNFYEFVNAYRIEAFKKMILDKNQSHKTLLAIALEAGFNSKSSFNRIFKQYTGQTPSQFKSENLL